MMLNLPGAGVFKTGKDGSRLPEIFPGLGQKAAFALAEDQQLVQRVTNGMGHIHNHRAVICDECRVLDALTQSVSMRQDRWRLTRYLWPSINATMQA